MLGALKSFFDALVDFLRGMGWLGTVALFVVLGLASVALGAVVVLRWPPDHFRPGPRPPFWAQRHPVVRVLGLAAKNLVGFLLVLLGIVMALPGVPGQGLILILIGLTLADFPGKRRLEMGLIRRPAVLRMINDVRTRFGHPPLRLD
jgi:hypothetical protein